MSPVRRLPQPLRPTGWNQRPHWRLVLLTSRGLWSQRRRPQPPKPRVNYVLGAIVSSSPDYAGGAERSYGLRPAWALEYGRFRLSSSRGNALMGHGLTAQSESGASAMLAQSERFSLRASLRIDQGDDGSDSPRRRGLPEVRSTLRARLSTGYALTHAGRWAQGFRKTFWGVTVAP